MIQIKEQDQTQTILSIENEMTIYTVSELKNAIYSHLKSDHKLQINLSDVTEIDSSGIQLLMFLKNEACHKKNSLIFIEHSQAVVDVVELFNLSSFFNDPVVISAEWSKA